MKIYRYVLMFRFSILNCSYNDKSLLQNHNINDNNDQNKKTSSKKSSGSFLIKENAELLTIDSKYCCSDQNFEKIENPNDDVFMGLSTEDIENYFLNITNIDNSSLKNQRSEVDEGFLDLKNENNDFIMADISEDKLNSNKSNDSKIIDLSKNNELNFDSNSLKMYENIFKYSEDNIDYNTWQGEPLEDLNLDSIDVFNDDDISFLGENIIDSSNNSYFIGETDSDYLNSGNDNCTILENLKSLNLPDKSHIDDCLFFNENLSDSWKNNTSNIKNDFNHSNSPVSILGISAVRDTFEIPDQNNSISNANNNTIETEDDFTSWNSPNNNLNFDTTYNLYPSISSLLDEKDQNCNGRENLLPEKIIETENIQQNKDFYDNLITNLYVKNHINTISTDKIYSSEGTMDFFAEKRQNIQYTNIPEFDKYLSVIYTDNNFYDLSPNIVTGSSSESSSVLGQSKSDLAVKKIDSDYSHQENNIEQTSHSIVSSLSENINLRKSSMIKNNKKINPDTFPLKFNNMPKYDVDIKQPKDSFCLKRSKNTIRLKRTPESVFLQNKLEKISKNLKDICISKPFATIEQINTYFRKRIKISRNFIKHEINSSEYVKNIDILTKVLIKDGLKILKGFRCFKNEDCDVGEFKKRLDFLSATMEIITEIIPHLARFIELFVEDVFEIFLIFDNFLNYKFSKYKNLKSTVDICETDVYFLCEHFDDLRKNRIFTGIFIEFFGFELENIDYTFRCTESRIDLSSFLSFHFSFQILKILSNEEIRPRLTYNEANNLKLLGIYKLRIREKILSLTGFFWIKERAMIYRQVANLESSYTNNIFGKNFKAKKEKTINDIKEFLFEENTHIRSFVLFFIVPIEKNKCGRLTDKLSFKKYSNLEHEEKNHYEFDQYISLNWYFYSLYILRKRYIDEKTFFRISRIYIPFLLSVNVLIGKTESLKYLEFMKTGEAGFKDLVDRNIFRIIQSLNFTNYWPGKHTKEKTEYRNQYKNLILNYLNRSLKGKNTDSNSVSRSQIKKDRSKLVLESVCMLKKFSLEMFRIALNISQ